ncbi:hypothetical protein KIPB_005643 [Kipferlia bialata]|uniref:Uncharacterized protein n=1 Tax=Kipferlia bialata TaxID=797122 RepID=A0A391NLC6_9EUKA|nr:hypothetical protein KIPB_005643 [Kipferlia bialata]|eukprot:g5643.t1
MTSVGRHIFVSRELASGFRDGPVEEEERYHFAYSYSLVSQEWTEHPVGDKTQTNMYTVDVSLAHHLGDNDIFFLADKSDNPVIKCAVATIPLPGGDDYVSAGRWNVMDPDA